MRKVLLNISLLFATVSVSAQSEMPVARRYPFLREDKNLIHNDSALFSFYDSLYAREKGDKDKIVIAHVGDSHIQADMFSGKVREELQRKFGNAGRGLVFPYRAARSNEPYSIRTSAKGQWKSGRNVVNRDSLPIGVTGFSIESKDSSALVFLRAQNAEGLDYSFKIVELFCENDSGFCKPDLSDSASVNVLKSAASEKRKETFVLPEKRTDFVLQRQVNDTTQPMRIYGINLLNEEKGLLYHTIGVNGAEFRHYNQSTFFFDQFFRLRPQLVIVSLGTNEAYGKSFNADVFIQNLKTFSDTIRHTSPGTTILFTIPSDSYRGKYRNRTVETVRTLMVAFCEANNYPYWDLFEVMGGAGSMLKWYQKGLTARDKLHFNRKGYELQAYLFNKAFLESYNVYSANKRL